MSNPARIAARPRPRRNGSADPVISIPSLGLRQSVGFRHASLRRSARPCQKAGTRRTLLPMRWTLLTILLLALILVPFFLFEPQFNALADRLARGEASRWYTALAIGGL